MILKLDKLHFAYGDKRLFDDFSLKLDSKATTAFLGPSGCGKTSLLRLIAGLIRPESGAISLDDGPVSVSMVFQEPRLFPWSSVLENIVIPAAPTLGKDKAKANAIKLLKEVGMTEYASSYPDELSGGQRQRTALARAFSYPAPIVLMDEPFQSLDLPLRVQLMDLTVQLSRIEDRGALIVTHDPREAIYIADRIIVFTAAPVRIVLDEALPLVRSERRYASSTVAELESRVLEALSATA